MSTGRLLEMWVPPVGYRLVSILATTYQLQADFMEEDLLPVALGLRLPAAKGRDFRVELEHALQTVDVTIYLHPDGYQAGLRRSPRIDLIPLSGARVPKLHAKVSLLQFIRESDGKISDQIIRMVIGSANLTAPGYRDNIEVALSLEDAPGADAESVTAVRDAAEWLSSLVPAEAQTDQAQRQIRSLRAVFAARPVTPSRSSMRFVSLPRPGGLVDALAELADGDVQSLTLVSPFWPTGDEPVDVVAALLRACKGTPRRIRLIGPAQEFDGRIYPEMPVTLLRNLVAASTTVEVAAADPAFGCGAGADQDEQEYAKVGGGGVSWLTWRSLHAKILLLEGVVSSTLAVGSFNLTRKGMGLHGRGNTEAGVIWNVRGKDRNRLAPLTAFATSWRKVEGAFEDLVKPPPLIEGTSGQIWPEFVQSIVARRDSIQVNGNAAHWPERVTLMMRDLRSRLIQKECFFDPWVVVRPDVTGGFVADLPLTASWLESENTVAVGKYPPLPDLEIELAWGEQRTTLPVVFLDKHEFPVVERSIRESERALIDWFLGFRPAEESEADGFAHSIDPVQGEVLQEVSDTTDILSYLVRDFVHALPGVHARLTDGGTTETGLCAVLFGPRSPRALADQVFKAWRSPQPGDPRKTAVATAFQLAELLKLVQRVHLSELPEDATERLRAQCFAKIQKMLVEVAEAIPSETMSPALKTYLRSVQGNEHAAA